MSDNNNEQDSKDLDAQLDTLNAKIKSIKKEIADKNAAAKVGLSQETASMNNTSEVNNFKSLVNSIITAAENQNKESNAEDTEETYVLPTFGRPIMPSQITPMQVKTEYEEVITKIAQSKNKTFAVFAIDEKLEKKGGIKPDDFPKVGTLVRLLHAKAIPGEVHFVCEGLARVTIKEWKSFNKIPAAVVSFPENTMPESGSEEEVKVKAYAMNLVSLLQELLPLNPMYSDEMRQYLLRFDHNDPSLLADCAASVTTTSAKSLQKVLETTDILKRLELSQNLIQKELRAAKLHDEIKTAVNEKLSKKQKEYVLREQLKQIQKELGTRADNLTEADELIDRMKKLSPPDYITKRFEKEVKKLNVIEPGSPEYAGVRNYLEVLSTIPWGEYAKEELDITKAREILNEDHEGLLDVKDRILEFLAVGALKGSTNGSILLFVGPPGVGKTSIGKSIAKALNRPFYRLSLGGVNDESVIKGHRKTYVGAMPGKFVQALRESKVMNPVIMLDEVDKMTRSYHGDPASTLLETLDPEQNNSFMDHYLDEKLDLSKCLFICTANTTDTIPPALLDRMDPIRLSGYISQEKLLIAKKHLLPKGLEKANMKKSQLKISDSVLKKIIEEYARESGMRSTQRAIDRIIRKAAVKILEGEKKVTVTADSLFDYLGTAPFKREKKLEGVGVITGLAWTSLGGATLPIESSKVGNDEKRFELTGSLGDVMKESAHIAYSYIQSHLGNFCKEKKDFFKKASIHIHVPEGATPKDGPSAGVTLASSLLSLAMNKPPKKGFAMTGELSLTGQVLAIGGIKEKTIAARRMGITNIICPKANEEDVKELPEEVTEGVNYYYADTFPDVVKVIFGSDKT